MPKLTEDHAPRWEPFGVTETDFEKTPEHDGVRVVNVRLGGGQQPGRGGRWWLRAAAIALGVLAAAAAAVSWNAQYRMVKLIKHDTWVAVLEGGIPDVGAVVFAALGIALALHGKRAIRPRALNAACVGISLAMNAIAAAPGWRDLAIWVMPAGVYALASDTLIGVVRAWALARAAGADEALADDGPTPLGMAGAAALWLLRLSLAPRSTLAGFRDWVVTDCPVAPGLRPGHVAELEAVRRKASEHASLVAADRDQAVEHADAEARRARDEAARAQAAAEAGRAEMDRVRSDASRHVAEILSAAEKERDELRLWVQQQADRNDAALEKTRGELLDVSGRLAKALQAANRPARSRAPRADRQTKRNRMIALAGQRRELATMPVDEAAKLASEVAAEIGYSPGTARRELVRHIRQLQQQRPVTGSADEGADE